MQSRVSGGLHKSPTGNFSWKKSRKRSKNERHTTKLKKKGKPYKKPKKKKRKAKVHYATLGSGLLFSWSRSVWFMHFHRARERIPHLVLSARP